MQRALTANTWGYGKINRDKRKEVYTRYSYGEDPPRERKRTIPLLWFEGPAALAEYLGMGVDLDDGRWKREEERE